MSRKLKLIAWLGVVAIAGLAMAGILFLRYLEVTTSNVSISNGSDRILNNARLVWARQVVWTGDILPSATHMWRGRPGGEGSVELTFDVDGRSVSTSCCYVTFDLGSSIEFAVSPALEVTATDHGPGTSREEH